MFSSFLVRKGQVVKELPKQALGRKMVGGYKAVVAKWQVAQNGGNEIAIS